MWWGLRWTAMDQVGPVGSCSPPQRKKSFVDLLADLTCMRWWLGECVCVCVVERKGEREGRKEWERERGREREGEGGRKREEKRKGGIGRS